jgi:ABC-type enterochelin transport system permease subunit
MILIEVGHEIMLPSGCAISGIVILDDFEVISRVSVFVGGTLSIFIELFEGLLESGELLINEFFEIIA